jgi:predicted AAA+ superfamily ATPase
MNDKNIIQRNYYVDQIVASIGTPVIKVISGMRRVGKTSIMQSVIDHLIERGEIASSSVFVLNKELPEFWDVRDA